MLPNPLYSHCIRRAAEMLGGFDNLGAQIDVSPRQLMRWARGVGAPPDAIFLKIVDILLGKQGPPEGIARKTRKPSEK